MRQERVYFFQHFLGLRFARSGCVVGLQASDENDVAVLDHPAHVGIGKVANDVAHIRLLSYLSPSPPLPSPALEGEGGISARAIESSHCRQRPAADLVAVLPVEPKLLHDADALRKLLTLVSAQRPAQ